MPDPVSRLEVRMSTVEQNQATLHERVRGVVEQFAELRPVQREVAILGEQVSGMAADIASLAGKIDAVGDMLAKRDQQASSERTSVKVALISLTGVVLTSVIGGVVAVLIG